MCLPAPEVKKVIQEMDEGVIQDVEVDGHQECVMEEADAQLVIYEDQQSKDQQIEVSPLQHSIGTSFGDILDALRKTIEEIKVDNALVKERLDK